MQQIERYGAIALVFIVVTFLAVFLWDSDSSDEASSDPGARGRIVAAPEEAAEPVDRTFRLPREIEGTAREPRQLPLTLGGDAGPTERSGRLGQDGEGPRRGADREQGAAGVRENAPAQDLRVDSARLASTTPAERPAARRGDPGRVPEPRRNQVQPGASVPVELQRPNRDGTITSDLHPVATVRSAGSGSPRPVSTVSVGGSAGGSSATPGSIRVRAGDTLERIARRELGDGARWREIQALNGNIDPRRLAIGMRLELPSRDKEATGSPGAPAPARRDETLAAATPSGGRVYVVKKGDMLSRIAQRELGSARLWPKIVAANPGIEPDRILVGAKLVLPAGLAPEPDRVVAQATPAEASRFRVR